MKDRVRAMMRNNVEPPHPNAGKSVKHQLHTNEHLFRGNLKHHPLMDKEFEEK